MKDRLSQLALGVFLSILVVGIVVISLASFIDALHSPVLIAAWVITVIVAFLFGLCVWRVSYVRHEREQHQVVDAAPQAPQLPAPRWVRVSDTTLTRSDRIDAEALRASAALRDANAPPTRDALQAHAGVYGHEQARAIIGKWTSWGWVTQPRQGVPARWVGSDDEN